MNPKVYQTHLGQGRSLHIIQEPKFNTVSLALLLRQPLQRETVTANALIPHILQRGCAPYDSLAKMQAKAESLYGAIFDVQTLKKGEQQLLQFYMGFLSPKVIPDSTDITGECMRFIANVMTQPLVKDEGFMPEFVAGEKDNLQLAIQSRKNNRGEYAKLRCVEEMCQNEPFGLLGDGYEADLPSITPKNCYSRYKDILESSPMDFVVMGDLEPKAIEEAITQLFPTQDRGHVLSIPLPSPVYNPGQPKTITEEMGISQCKLVVGYRSGIAPVSDDYYALLLASELWGGSAGGKLFSVVREKESLCYYINSFVYRFKGIVLMQAGVEKDKVEKTLELANRLLADIAKGNVTKQELENARNSLSQKFTTIADHPSAVMDFYLSQHMLGDTDTVEDTLAKIQKTPKAAIFHAAEKLYADTIYTLV